MSTPSRGFQLLLQAIDRLGVRYCVGGSMASGVHGLPRATMDIDVVAELLPQHARRFSQLLGAEFYADAETMERAIHAHRAFNVIHIASSYKFDVFPAPDEPFYDNQLERRELAKADVYGTMVEFPVASAEDTIIAKLDWYRIGGETSEKQWADVLGIVQVKGDQLDLAYLRLWAANLHLGDLLERLLASAR